jgi:aerobic carbon-monoxide dehydrogenase medium subunit
VKPPAFEYETPGSLDEALSALERHGEDAKFLAGGQSLVPLLALRLASPTALVDLGRVQGLDYIRRENGYVAIGAMTRERTVERSDVVADAVPLLAAAMPLIGHVAIRNRGTIGGSTAHADPSAEIPAVVVALDAEVVVRSAARGERTIPASEFFLGFFTTALEHDEAVVEIRFPLAAPGTGAAFEEATRRHGDFAVVGAAANVQVDAGRIAQAGVSLIGVGETPVRRPEAESVLVGAAPDAAVIQEAAERASDGLSPHSDLHGTSTYRRHLATTLVRRALTKAIAQAGGTR